MTRDEAIEIEVKSAMGWEPFSKIPDACIREAAAGTIDCYVALGMLKLDEPKSVDVKAAEVITKYGKDHGYLVIGDAINIIDRLHIAGLKIVEE